MVLNAARAENHCCRSLRVLCITGFQIKFEHWRYIFENQYSPWRQRLSCVTIGVMKLLVGLSDSMLTCLVGRGGVSPDAQPRSEEWELSRDSRAQ